MAQETSHIGIVVDSEGETSTAQSESGLTAGTSPLEIVVHSAGVTTTAQSRNGLTADTSPLDIVVDSAGVTTQSGNGSTTGPSHVTPNNSDTGTAASGTLQASTNNVLISKVRGQVRAVDEYSYTPHYVPIGPYHHVKCSSTQIELEKQRTFSYLLNRSMMNQSVAGGGGLVGLENELTPLVEACYPDRECAPEEQLKSTMLLHDGCYVLSMAVNYRRGNSANNGDLQGSGALSSNSSQGSAQTTTANNAQGNTRDSTVVRDTVFLVENQIPFFVLEMIHERVTGDATSSPLQTLADFVQRVLQDHRYISKHPRPVPSQQTTTAHLLHLLHGYLKPSTPPQAAGAAAMGDNNVQRTGRWRRATEYCKYGDVRFKHRIFKDDDEEEWTILDVHLQGGIVWIPRLQVDDMTWTILRNLMALEELQECSEKKRPVTAYCVFMSQVACKPEDVELLRRKGVLEQFLVNDEEVAKGFANLCRGVLFDVDDDDANYLKPFWHELDELCSKRRNYCFGSFRQMYWSDPMLRGALIFSTILFLCQLAQVILALIPVVRNKK